MILQRIILGYNHFYSKHQDIKGSTYIFRALRNIDFYRNLEIKRGYAELEFFNKKIKTVEPYDLRSLYSEISTSKFVKENSSGKVFYDIGSHHGIYSILASKSSQTYAFEIVEDNIQTIKKNKDLNNLEELEIVEKAAHSKNGYITHENSLQGSNATGKGTKKVSCIRLDDLVKENDSPNLIKIDVEGAEYQVLKGAERVLEEHRPTLVIEIHEEKMDNIYGDRKKDLFDLLDKKGYKIDKKARDKESRQIIAIAY